MKVVDRVEIVDLNGDGRLDIAIAEERYPGLEPNSNLRVFLAGNNPVSDPWEHRVVVTQWSMNNLDAVDMDQDGDVDLVTNEHKGTEHKTEIYLNDGKANFTPSWWEQVMKCTWGPSALTWTATAILRLSVWVGMPTRPSTSTGTMP